MSENKAIGKIESYYLKHRRNSIYVALEEVNDHDFFWSETEIQEFEQLWKEDCKLTEIVEIMERSEISVFLLAIDRLMKGKIKRREDWRVW